MTLTGIILIIVIGIIFVLIEILVIPGVGVVGIIGVILMAVGVYFAYKIDAMSGHITLAGSMLVSSGLLALSLRAKTWEKISLKEELTGKVNTLDENSVKAGDIGIASSRLAPIGKAMINGHYFEVKSYVGFIDESTEIVVLKVEGKNIIVKAKV
ncbi:MAG: hypothetical protein COA57_15370 [Flavobacteriales bacterium]|nr:MAG: hypothetical protein COA57_15370 [Flavobacteriales bacterium]